MERELQYDETDYEFEHMDHFAVIDDDEDQEVYEYNHENN